MLETIKIIRVGITECASHSHASNPLTGNTDGKRSTTIIPRINISYVFIDCIVYSPNKYRETEGIKDIGTNFWNQGRTQEIKERALHL